MNFHHKNNAERNRQFATALRGYRLALIGFQCPCKCGAQIRVDHKPISPDERQVLITGCCEAGRAKATEIIAKHIEGKGGQGM